MKTVSRVFAFLMVVSILISSMALTVPAATDSFSLGSSGGTVSFNDSASISVNLSGPATVKVTLSGNPNTKYQVWYTSGNTYKYIYANGSSCSKFFLTGGVKYIRIDPYSGGTGWVTAKITT